MTTPTTQHTFPKGNIGRTGLKDKLLLGFGGLNLGQAVGHGINTRRQMVNGIDDQAFIFFA